MVNIIKKRLGDNLLEIGKITREQLRKGLKFQKEKNIPLGKALEQLGYLSEQEIIEALSDQLGVPYVALLEEASEKLLKVLDLDILLGHLLHIAKNGINADRGTVFIVDYSLREIKSRVLIGDEIKEIKIPIGKGIAGTVAETGRTINIRDAYKDIRFNKEIDKKTGYKTKSILCMPITNTKNEIIGVFQMINKKDGVFKNEDENFLKSLSNFSATALELAKLNQQMIEKKRLEEQLSIARQMQENLFPKTIIKIPGYKIYGYNSSCEEVCGDYYDFYHLGESKWLFAIGDVSGKGVPASIIMAVLQSHLRAITNLDYNLPRIMQTLNEYLVNNSSIDKFVTFFLGVLDSNKNTFEYVNAGHNPPYLIDSNKSIKDLNINGPIIGMFDGLEYTQSNLKFNKGELLFCYTDGVTERFNQKEQEYGERRLAKFLKANRDLNPDIVVSEILKDLDKFSKGAKQNDDVTFLLLKRVS